MHPLQTRYAEARDRVDGIDRTRKAGALAERLALAAEIGRARTALYEAEDAMCLGMAEETMASATGQAAMFKRVILASGVIPAMLLANHKTRAKFVELCFRLEIGETR